MMGGTETFAGLADVLGERFDRGVAAASDDGEFGSLALRVFRVQFGANPVYRRFCEGRGRTPDTVTRWTEIPPVPATAFKRLPLVTGDPREVEAVYRTSGTSRGDGARGTHRVRRLDLYRRSAIPNLRAHLLPDLSPGERIPVVALLPPPDLAPDSSLSAMVGFLMEEAGAPPDEGTGWYGSAERGVDVHRAMDRLEELAEEGRAALIATTAFALVHLLDGAEAAARAITMPPGSRMMETGGFKGRSREVPRAELYGAVERRLGLPASRIVNEYGMTELLSQFYEPVLLEGAPARLEERLHRGPPWVRTRVVDPVTLDAVPVGEPGILCHMDLANLGSVAHVLTEDRGVLAEETGEAESGRRFTVLGRAAGAEPRGCSLAMEEILGASGG